MGSLRRAQDKQGRPWFDEAHHKAWRLLGEMGPAVVSQSGNVELQDLTLTEVLRDWPWSSLRHQHLSDSIPAETPSDWLQWIDQPLFDHELTTLRTCVNRQQPFGAEDWQETIAAALGLESTLRRRGRPARRSEK